MTSQYSDQKEPALPQITPTYAPASKREQKLVLAVTSISYVMIILDTTIVNVALDRMATTFSTDITGLQWIVSAYTLSFAGLLLSGGALGDRIGARTVYLLGLALFTAASVICGVSDTLNWLIAGRVLQGIGAALLAPCSLSMLNQVHNNTVDRTKAIAWWATFGGVALAAGPVVGGVLTDAIGWRSIFLINVPIGVAGIGLTFLAPSRNEPSSSEGHDVAGQIFALIMLVSMMATLIEGPARGWMSPVVLGGSLIALLSSVIFFGIESRRKTAMMPLHLFRDLTFTGNTLNTLIGTLPFFGMIFSMSLYFQQVRNYSPLETGLAFVPCTLFVIVGNVVMGRFVGKMGLRWMLLFGAVIQVVGFGSLVTISSDTPLWWISSSLLLIGFGGGVRTPATAASIMAVVKKEFSGIGAGIMNSARQFGAALGVAVFGALLVSDSEASSAMANIFFLSTALSIAGVALTYFTQAPDSALQEENL